MSALEWMANLSRDQVEAYCRRTSQAIPFSDELIICRALGRFLMCCDARDLSFTPHVAFDGFWEVWQTMALHRLLRPGMRCIDVGANVGYLTLLMADCVDASGVVYAIEPMASNARMLCRNVALNGFEKRVQVLNGACGAAGETTATFTYEHENLTSCTMVSNRATWQGCADNLQTFESHVRTIDAVAAEHGLQQIEFLKIDAEGADYLILVGAAALLRASPNVMVMYEHCADKFGSCYQTQGRNERQWLEYVTAELQFSLSFVEYSSAIQNVTIDTVLSQPGRLWNLILQRVQ